jgi:solute carrier family 35 (UDP-xylose/UDP-N-acetylglucosamine transporter), member B4
MVLTHRLRFCASVLCDEFVYVTTTAHLIHFLHYLFIHPVHKLLHDYRCCLNVITLEFLTKYDKSAGNIITFAQFVVISLYGFFKNWDFGLWSFKARVLPLQNYVKMTSIFFVLSVVNNYAFVFNISVPLHSLFRSSSLPASIFVGWMFFSKKYTRLQVLACLLVTIGIIVTTVFESKVPSVPLSPSPCPGCDNKALPSSVLPPSAMGRTVADSFSPKVSYAIGVVFLFAALLLSAQLGHIQDLNYKSYTGSSWEEVMFYSHLLCLPVFLFLAPSIYERVLLWFGSPAFIPVNLPHLPPFSVSVWTMLLLNAITQLQCVTGVYSLTCLTSTLTANLVTTFRKFLSVMISVLYFRNPFEVPQMVGCLLVFGGVLIYGRLPSDQKGPAAMPVVQEVEEEEEEGEEEGEEREESYPVTPKSSKFQTTATSSMRKRR